MHNVDKWFKKRKYQSIQLFPFYSGFLMSEGYSYFSFNISH